MLPAGKGLRPLNRLGLRLVLLLGLALLPVGLIAMLQTYRVLQEANQRVDAALLGDSVNASADERRLITRVVGMGESLALAIPRLLEDNEDCNTHMRRLVEASPSIVFAGFTNLEGILACASSEVGKSVSTPEDVAARLDSGILWVTVSQMTQVSKTPGVVIRNAVFDNDRPIGYVTVTVPYSALTLNNVAATETKPVDVLTFDAVGTPLTSEAGLGSVERRLPRNRALANLGIDTGAVFQDTDFGGRERIYSVVPLVPGQIFTLAVWPVNAWRIGLSGYITALAFPILMWLASLAVAFIAVNRLVIRHIRSLRRDIRAFSATRRVRWNEDPAMPAELREVTEAFASMTRQILHDEADQENLLHEKNVLLKEVHHRVKNNLQLIASITNMQIRRSRSSETKFMLRRLQDRVMSLATVHRSLYLATVLSEVRADNLVSELARQLAHSGEFPGTPVNFSIETDAVLLYPDQAVPLSLLVTEAITNAYKYLGRPETGEPWVTLTLKSEPRSEIVLLVRNSAGEPMMNHDEAEVSGLGSQLIAAFVMQLGGTHTSGLTDDGNYEVRVTFSAADFSEDPVDTAAPGIQ